jgi:hypothetical protein
VKRYLPLSVAFPKGRNVAPNGCRRIPFDPRSFLRNAVGIYEYDLPYPVHGLGRHTFFESFQPPSYVSCDHFVGASRRTLTATGHAPGTADLRAVFPQKLLQFLRIQVFREAPEVREADARAGG